jgi:hypothetical protein
MRHVATLRYSEKLIRSAVLSFWWRVMGWKFPVVFLACCIGLVWLISTGDRSWSVGALAAAALFSALFAVALYVVHLRNSLAKFKALGEPRAELVAEETTFTVESSAGRSTLPWSAVQEIWEFEEFWLVMFSKAHFMTLPLADLPAEMQAFIQEKAAASRLAHVG